MKMILILITIFYSLVSCVNKLPSEEINLVPLKEVSYFQDTIFFTKINDIFSHNDELIFIDRSTGQIIKSDFELNYRGSIGRFGGGPLEFSSPSLGYIYNNKLFCHDPGNGKILSIPMEEGEDWGETKFKFYDVGKFIVNDGHMFFFDRKNEKGKIIRYDLASQSIINNNGNRAAKELNNPMRHMVEFSEGFFSIYGENKPLIEHFDFEGNLKGVFDFSELAIFKDALGVDTSKDLIMTGNTANLIVYRNIVWDAQFINGKLYLLVLSKKNETTLKSNTLLVFDWKNEILEHSMTANFPVKGWYSRFHILPNNDYLIAFDEINGVIEKFKI